MKWQVASKVFWSSEKIVERQSENQLIDPFDPSQVKHGAYELAVGPEAFITSQYFSVKSKLAPQDAIVIPPGQLGILMTEELVSIPRDAIGFISMRTRVKLGGLINVSGFHVDSGFSGRLKFSVYNAGSNARVLHRGEPIFLLWFADLDRTTADGYNGGHQNQTVISGDDQTLLQGHVASPAQLKHELDDVTAQLAKQGHRIDLLQTLLVAIVIGLLTVIALPTLRQSIVSEPSSIQNTPVPLPVATSISLP